MNGFKQYNITDPLVYIHIFKTAGTSMRHCFNEWYKADNSTHVLYHHDQYPGAPLWSSMCNSQTISLSKPRTPIFMGHFYNKDYTFPSECKQFITMLRNPLKRAISAYYYNLSKHQNTLLSLETYLTLSDHTGITKSFTKELFFMENYKEIIQKYFVYIGTTEEFSDSLLKTASLLNKPATPEMLYVWKNKTDYIASVSEKIEDQYRAKHKLEYAIYDYVVELNKK